MCALVTGVQTCALPISPLDDTAAVASRAAGLLAEQPEVMTVFQDIGSDGADVRMAMLYLRLKPGADRERTSVEFERAMAPRLQAIPDARISFQSQSSGTGRDITIKIGRAHV